MSRGVGAANETELAKSGNTTCLLVSFFFDGGTQRFTDAGINIVHGGNTWQPANLLNVDAINENLDMEVQDIEIVLSGVNQANVSTALTETYTDRKVTVERAMIDSSGVVVVDPFEIFAGFLDYPDYEETGSSATLAWHATSHWVLFDKRSGRRTNDEDQQIHFSGDLGFEFAPNTEEIKWGRP